jgi:hypothetical protein
MVESLAGAIKFYKARFNIWLNDGELGHCTSFRTKRKIWRRGWDSNPRMEVLQFCGQELSCSFSWAISSVLTA